jgi:hypothetical protein
MNETEEVILRLKGLFGVDSDIALCKALNLSPQTVSSWKTRNKIPYAICVDVAEDYGVTLDWLLTGSGEMYRQPKIGHAKTNETATESAPNESLTSRQRAVLELFASLSEDDQREILRNVEKKKRLSELEKHYSELRKEVERLKNFG